MAKKGTTKKTGAPKRKPTSKATKRTKKPIDGSKKATKRTKSSPKRTKSTKSVIPSKKKVTAKKPAQLQRGQKITAAARAKKAIAVCEMYALNEHTLRQCLTKNGIASDSTWYDWVAKFEEIEDLFKIAKHKRSLVYDNIAVEEAKKTILALTKGFEYTEVREVYQQTNTIDEEGNEIVSDVILASRTEVKKRAMPSLAAATYILNNKNRKEFQRNPEPDKGDNTGGLPFTGFRFVTRIKEK